MNVHCSFICKAKEETGQMSISKWMDEQIVVCLYHGILLSMKKNRPGVHTAPWLNLRQMTLREMREANTGINSGSIHIKYWKIQNNQKTHTFGDDRFITLIKGMISWVHAYTKLVKVYTYIHAVDHTPTLPQ